MPRQRKKLDTSLKLAVVRRIKEQGLSVQHVSRYRVVTLLYRAVGLLGGSIRPNLVGPRRRRNG